MMLIKPCAWHHPFWLKPHDDFDTLRMGVVRYRPQAVGKPLRIWFPCSRIHPTPLEGIPASVHPPIIDFEAFLQVAANEHLLIFLVRVLHLDIFVRTVSCHLRWRHFSIYTRQDVRYHPLSPDILALYPITFIKLERDQRGTNLFARMQQKVSQLLASLNSEFLPPIAGKARHPFPWPSHRHYDSSPGPHDIKVGPIAVGRPAPNRTKLLHIPRRKCGFKRFKVRGRRRTALVVNEERIPRRCCAQSRCPGVRYFQGWACRLSPYF